ncbi:MAG: S-layer homology domain-containing protein, partial [Firmicutes bacterium]|nr:S-layer homology domain-containing protein [Bacillota bacterium]
MKGKLSRMWRSGLSMMLALVMMFSLGTVAFATEGSEVAKDVAEDVVVVTQNLVDVLKDNAEVAQAEAVAKYVYGSFAEQGYVTLVVKSLEEAVALLEDAANRVENTAEGLSPELKAELKDALIAAKNAVVDLIEVAKTVEDVNSDTVKAAAAVAVSKIESVKVIADKIGEAGTLEDALLIKNLVVDAAKFALNAANKLVDLLVAAIYDATHETIVIPCDGAYNVAYVGDKSVETYAADVAENLGAKMSDVASADMVLMGYSVYSATQFVNEQLRSGKELNWAAVAEIVKDTNYVDVACGALYNKLIDLGVSDELVDPIIVVLSSYVYAYAKYILDYPMEVAEMNDDALVVVVGQYNPLKGVSLKVGDVAIDLGLCLESLVEASGLYNLASAMMMPNCIYVDVTDANVATKMAPVECSVEELLMLALNAEAQLPATGDEIEKAVMDALEVIYAGHVAVEVPAVDATCTEPGCTAGTKCEVCGKILEGCDVVPALGHKWDGGVVTPADRYLDTMIIFTCERCGITRTEAYNKFHEHFFDGDDKNNDGVIEFRPEGDITRAEVAVVFYRLLNDKYTIYKVGDPYEAKGIFTDVATGDWFAMQVEVLADLGIVAGYPDGSFDPWAPITRAEFATMAFRLA